MVALLALGKHFTECKQADKADDQVKPRVEIDVLENVTGAAGHGIEAYGRDEQADRP